MAGGPEAPARLLRSVPGLDGPAPANPLDKHILQLIALHKDVAQQQGAVAGGGPLDGEEAEVLGQVDGGDEPRYRRVEGVAVIAGDGLPLREED